MATYKTRISGGKVYLSGHLIEADLLIDNGKIAAIVRPGEPADAAEVIDATGKAVLPGIIDTHAHTRVPGYEHKEDYASASRAAAVGGITTMIDMPNVEPPTDTVENFEAKREIAARDSLIDFGHWVAATDVEEIGRLAKAGATGYKIFQVSGAYPHDPRLAINDEGRLMESFRAIERVGLPALVHPFNQGMFERLTAEALAAGKPNNWYTFGEVYTTEEIWHTAVNTLINIQRLTGARLNVVHTHSGKSLDLIREAKERGQRVTASVDPKYYHLTLADLMEKKGRACPGGFITEDPARMATIWRALNDGTMDMIDADHAPHTLEELDKMEDDAFNAAMGSPQYDWHYSITLTDVNNGKLPLSRAIELLCEYPAKFLGIEGKKGKLIPGADADLVLVDMEREHVLTDDGLQTKVGWTPYLGWKIKGYVELTMARGTVIAKDRVIVGEAGDARFIEGVGQ